MAEQYTHMSREEFAKKIVAGERNFRRIHLPNQTDLSAFIPDLNKYLVEQNLEKDKIDFSKSELIEIIAPAIYIPFSNMFRAYMYGANMSGAYMYRANMHRANMSGADMHRANMSGADMSEANMYGADMSRAYMYGANMSGAYMYRANMSGADMHRANMSGANMSGANMSGADMSGANMSGADIRSVNLERVMGLKDVIFKNTLVTKEEKEIILKAREGLDLFDLREE